MLSALMRLLSSYTNKALIEMKNDINKKCCSWQKDGVNCSKDAYQDGLCQEHYQARGKNTLGGAVGGVVAASLVTANPLGLILAAIAGGIIGSSVNNGGKDD